MTTPRMEQNRHSCSNFHGCATVQFVPNPDKITAMTTIESQSEKHTRLAHQLLGDAEREIAAGDLVQGAEKLWGATSRALKAYCASRGMAHGQYQHRRRAVLELATQLNNPSVRLAFGVAESCHANFYNDWMEQEHLDAYLPDIRELVHLILDTKAT